ncbi:unnamed protein product [Arctia plantaginis]|uniref:Uncharacterized protein n=1 Tax=Arctia plantaginis TaxID=874455 RepID=A0A8S0ZK14_ARCPL|nr:unnamed protein product [Arctia plantaginis]
MNSHSPLSGGLESAAKKLESRPSPLDFAAYLPWACGQLEISLIPIINRITISDALRSNATSGKDNKEETLNADIQSGSDFNDIIGGSSTYYASDFFHIDAVYDDSNNLIQLKFKNKSTIPVTLFKLLTLIVQFQTCLKAIYINRGLNKSGLYQLNKVVNIAHITDIILDNTTVTEANYYILLDDDSPLKYLSLSRCKLNDTAVKMIALRLQHPSKASKTLTVLNLSSNKISDEGAKYLGDTLRTNRQLAYLNLSGNLISDTGVDGILSSLITFKLTTDEINEKRARKLTYIQAKNKFINETVERMYIEYEKKVAAKKKTFKVPTVTKRSKSIEASQDIDTSIGVMDEVWLEKAEAVAAEMVAPFQDPFSCENIIVRDNVLYCYGNNTLRYLNLAYNNLSYYSVKKLHNVISIQRDWDRKPKGLINVCIEGNQIPIFCKELSDINVTLEIGLSRMQNASFIHKKKTGKK